MKRQTVQRVTSPTAMLVALPEALAEACRAALGEGGLRILRVGDVASANERIPVVMPELVVVLSTLDRDARERLADRCVAVGADVLELPPDADARALAPRLLDAANAALIRAEERDLGSLT